MDDDIVYDALMDEYQSKKEQKEYNDMLDEDPFK